MRLTVTGKQLDIGEAFRNHIAERLDKILARYFGDAIEANVVVARDKHRYRAAITAHIGRAIEMAAEGEAHEPYPAFDDAAEHLAKRLRRQKRRLRDHRARQQEPLAAEPARAFILASEEPESEQATAGTDAVVVAEMDSEIPTISVSDAVLRLDLSNQPALLFRNSAHGELNMIYRRGDGHIGWVDPAGRAPKRA